MSWLQCLCVAFGDTKIKQKRTSSGNFCQNGMKKGLNFDCKVTVACNSSNGRALSLCHAYMYNLLLSTIAAVLYNKICIY